MIDALKEWWGPLIGALGMFASYIAGKERTRSRIREVTEDLDEVKTDLKTVKDGMATLAVQMATMTANIDWIKRDAEKRKP